MCFNVYFLSSKINNYANFSYISKLSSETGQKDVENSDTPIDSSKNPTTHVRSQIGELRLISMYCLGCAVDINVFSQSDVSTVEGFA